jgi:predicted RNA-binding Zn ribbon-like protein
MQVSTSTSPPSRAGSLDLIADDLALNFANTESGRGFPSHENHLREAEHVAQWLKHAKALPAEDADWLARQVAKRARFVAHAALAPGVLSCRWRWSVRAAPVEAALGPIALAAVRLFTEGDFHRIRACGGHACGWLFYDRSKNNRRRWCEMEVCGNRAKQRRLAARRRGD